MQNGEFCGKGDKLEISLYGGSTGETHHDMTHERHGLNRRSPHGDVVTTGGVGYVRIVNNKAAAHSDFINFRPDVPKPAILHRMDTILHYKSVRYQLAARKRWQGRKQATGVSTRECTCIEHNQELMGNDCQVDRQLGTKTKGLATLYIGPRTLIITGRNARESEGMPAAIGTLSVSR